MSEIPYIKKNIYTSVPRPSVAVKISHLPPHLNLNKLFLSIITLSVIIEWFQSPVPNLFIYSLGGRLRSMEGWGRSSMVQSASSPLDGTTEFFIVRNYSFIMRCLIIICMHNPDSHLIFRVLGRFWVKSACSHIATVQIRTVNWGSLTVLLRLSLRNGSDIKVRLTRFILYTTGLCQQKLS